MKSRIWLFRFLILCLSAFESGVVPWAAQPSEISGYIGIRSLLCFGWSGNAFLVFV